MSYWEDLKHCCATMETIRTPILLRQDFNQAYLATFFDFDNDTDTDILLISQSGGEFASTIYRNETVSSIIEKKAGTTLQLFPNTVSEKLTIQFNSSSEPFTVNVYNLLGEQMFNSANGKYIDVASFSKGIYFINVQQGSKRMFAKFVNQ